MSQLPRPWEVAGTTQYTPEMLAALERMPLIRRPEGSPTIRDVIMNSPPEWPDEKAVSSINNAIVDCEAIKERAQADGLVEIATEAEAAVSALEDLMHELNKDGEL